MTAQGMLLLLCVMLNATTDTLKQLVRDCLFRRISIFGSLAALGASDTAVTETPIFQAPRACTIISVAYVGGAITASDTDKRVFTFSRRAAADGGTQTTVATRTCDVAGGGATANVAYGFTLSATAANLEFAAGDIMTFAATDAGTAPAIPAGIIVITYDLAKLS